MYVLGYGWTPLGRAMCRAVGLILSTAETWHGDKYLSSQHLGERQEDQELATQQFEASLG